MLTIDDVRAIPLFSTLAAPELERLAQTSADLHLAAGEFAVHEGGTERALFAVLSGKIEVVKLFDGIERTLGWRVPGTIFGEVPIALGTPFYGGYRASEPSRVMRVESRQYYAIAAASPEISLKVSALARERIGGMQGIAAEPPKPRVTMVGHRWDTACGELRRFLARNQITFDWMTPDAPELPTRWPGARCRGRRLPGAAPGRRDAAQSTGGARRCPASRPANERAPCRIRHHDHRRRAGRSRGGGVRRIRGTAHARGRARGARRPGRDVLAHRELSRIPQRRLGRRARESRAPAGKAARGGDPGHALGRPHRSGDAPGLSSMATMSSGRGPSFLPPASTWRRLAIDGFDRLIGKGIYYGAARSEASATHGLDVHLIGAGNSAGQAALYFANHARTVTLVVRGDSLEKSMSRYLIEQLAREIERRRSSCARKWWRSTATRT